MAEWPSVELSDGTRAKHLCFLIEPIEEITAPIALVGQENASARRLCQPACGDLVSSVWSCRCSEGVSQRIPFGSVVNGSMDLESVKPVSRGFYAELRAVLSQ